MNLNNELQSKYKNIIYEFNYHKNFDLKQNVALKQNVVLEQDVVLKH